MTSITTYFSTQSVKSIKTFALSLLALTCLFSNINSYADNYHQTMADYIRLKEPIDTSLKLVKQSSDPKTHVTKLEYTFSSQVWPKTPADQKAWQHTVNIYVPQKIQSTTALIWINGGTNQAPLVKQPIEYPNYDLDFIKIADQAQTVIIDLQDIPNQYLTLEQKQYAEDAFCAFTATKFIKDPVTYKYYSAYLPMVKAVIETLDNTQKINFSKFTQTKDFKINDFILSGLSKRGLTTWLAALQDDRIKAIIPIAIDILNTERTITHIFNTYQSWPQALHDYDEQKMLENLHSKNAAYLMQIIDPYQYITCHQCSSSLKSQYLKRASVDKYIILSSGDDFFVPDSLKFYFHAIPGKKYLRAIPNSYHYIDNKILDEAILSYVYLINNQKNNHNNKINNNLLPTQTVDLRKNVTAKNKYDLKISTTKKPLAIKLYAAHNSNKRDFRLASGIKYDQINLSPEKYNLYKNKKNQTYTYTVTIDKPESGWKAYFVELEYGLHNNKNVANLKLTTSVEILPTIYPEIIKSIIKNETKEIIQYGKDVLYPGNK